MGRATWTVRPNDGQYVIPTAPEGGAMHQDVTSRLAESRDPTAVGQALAETSPRESAWGAPSPTRNGWAPALTRANLRAVEAPPVEAERAVATTSVVGDADNEGTLAVLTASYPTPAFLFDASGALQWASKEGTMRLGSGRLGRGTEALTRLGLAAREARSEAGLDVDAPLRGSGLLRGGERAVIRWFKQQGKVTVLIALAPPSVAALPALGGASPDRVPGLGASESAVVRLAAEGYTVLNMSARLGVSEATVRTHLRRSYAKLGVHSRAELAMVLFKGRG
jgi:DNA-binding CsgD family transcriptional regulator